MRSSKCRRSGAQRARWLVACGLVAVSGAVWPQGFLADFYNQAGSGQANVTQAGVYQGAGLNTVTGGGFVFKAPQRGFHPYYVTPPSLRYGCGGIDIFLGAFSLPSKEEFVAFLRNIGQNLPGLAFQLALQSLAPDLEKQVSEFRKMIMEWSAKSIDACAAAKAILEKGREFMDAVTHRTKNEMRATGQCSDEADCVGRTKTDLGTVLANCRAVTNSEGSTEEACEMNVVWAMLKGGGLGQLAGMPDTWRELVMSALGTTVHRVVGNGPDAAIRPVPYAKTTDPTEFIGAADQPTVSVPYYRCNETTHCLEPIEATYVEKGLARWVYEAATKYMEAILDRDPTGVSLAQMHLITSATSVPLLRIINAVTYRKTAPLAQDVLIVYSEAAAYELAMQFFDSLLAQAEKASKAQEAKAQMKYVHEYAKTLREDIRHARTRLQEQRRVVSERMARMGAFVTVVEHFERSLKTNLAAELAANLRFGAR